MCFWFRRGTASESPKKTSVANAVSGPTPGCVIKRTAAGCRRACWLTNLLVEVVDLFRQTNFATMCGTPPMYSHRSGFDFTWRSWRRECIHVEPKAAGAVEGKSLVSAWRLARQSPRSDPLRTTKRAITGHILRDDHPPRLPYRKIDLRERARNRHSIAAVPDAGASREAAVLMVTGDGKATSVTEAEQFVTSGTVVLSIDTRGTGETRVDTDLNTREFDHYFGDSSDIMTALLVGKTMVGMRALDISRGVDLLTSRKEVDPNQVYGYGKDERALPLLYASVLDGRIRRVVLDGMLVSYESVVNSKVHRRILEGVAPGMLKSYDLQDLVAALAPRKSEWYGPNGT